MAKGRVCGVFSMGVAAGAAIAVLYAPASGAATRRLLARRARASRGRATAMFKQGVVVFEEGGARMKSAVQEGRARLERMRAQAGSAFTEGREMAGRFVQHGRRAIGEARAWI